MSPRPGRARATRFRPSVAPSNGRRPERFWDTVKPALKSNAFPFLYPLVPKIRLKGEGISSGMLMRYAMLVGVAAVSVWGAVNLGTTNAGVFLVDAGQGAPCLLYTSPSPRD